MPTLNKLSVAVTGAHNRFMFQWSINNFNRGGLADMSNEFDDLAARFKSDQNDARMTTERLVHEHRLITDNGGELWGKVKSELHKAVDVINSRANCLKIRLTTGDRDVLHVDYDRGDGKTRYATAEYSHSAFILKLRGGNSAANSDYAIIAGGSGVTFNSPSGNKTPSEIVEELLGRLL